MKNAQDGMREKKESLKLFFPTRPFHHSIRLGPLTFRDPLLLCGVLYILLWMDAGGFLRAGLWAAFLHEMGHLLAYGMMLRKLPRVDVTMTGFCLRVPRESLRRAQLFGLAAAGPATCINHLAIQLRRQLQHFVFEMSQIQIYAP